MRLIDADAFMEHIGLDTGVAREENLGVIVGTEDLDRQPTAYDVDKVVERLGDMKYVMMGNYGVRREVVNFDDSIEAVKSGGVE